MELENVKNVLIKMLKTHEGQEQEAIKAVLNLIEKPALRVSYSDDGKYAYFNNKQYRKCRGNYYRRHENLHVAVMEYYSGQNVPQGYEVHHNSKDYNGNWDKSKNDIEHLQLMTKTEHIKLHNNTKIISNCQRCGKEFLKPKRIDSYYCDECKKIIKNKGNKEYYLKNAEIIKEYRKEHREKAREIESKYRENHREELREREHRYRTEHKEEINAKRRKRYAERKLEIMK